MLFKEKNFYCIHSYELISKSNYIRFNINAYNIPNKNRKIYLLKYDKNGFNLELLNNNKIIEIYNVSNYTKILLIFINEKNELFYLGSNNFKFEINYNNNTNSNFNIIKYPEIPLQFINYVIKNKRFSVPDEYPEVLYYINNSIRVGCHIFFLAYNDFCNTCRRYMKAIESAGLKTIGLKCIKHPFNYPDEMKVAKTLESSNIKILKQFPTIISINKNIDMYNGIIASVKYIQMHSTTYFIINNKDIDFKNKNKKLIITVGGSTYRFQKRECNDFFNKYIDFSISQCGDLYNYGLKNNRYIHYPLDTKYIRPDYSFKDKHKIVAGHFPSTTSVKGSKTITKAIYNVYNQFPNKLKYIGIPNELNDFNKVSSHRVSFDEQLARYKQCDIYIETLNPGFKLNNPAYPKINQEEPFGEWGNTCLEACYSGCIVISNCIFIEKYKKSYGIYPGFVVANTQSELEYKLKELILKPRSELLELKKKCVKWVEDNHSIEKIGKKMYQEIYSLC